MPTERHNTGPDKASNGTPESLANDRLVHGLLEFLYQDTESAQEKRVQAAMHRIRQDHRRPGLPFQRSPVRLIPLATAAIVSLVMVSIFVLAPQPAASAMVDAAIRATRAADGLRYEIRMVEHRAESEVPNTIGTIDMRDGKHLVRISTPEGHDFVMGRDREGDWSVRLDGTTDRADPKRAAPRWINLGERTVLIGSLDGLLDQLNDDYDLRLTAAESSEAPNLIGTHRAHSMTPGPDEVRIWIEPGTSLVDRLELSWNGMRGPRGEQPGSRGMPPPPPPLHAMRGRPPQHHPALVDGRPHFDQGRDPPPPRRIIFIRTDAAPLDDRAYSPPAP